MFSRLTIRQSIRRRSLIQGFILAALCGPAFSGISHAADETYTFSVVPQFDQRRIFAIWKPIVDEIARRTGLNLQLQTTLTIPDFERELAAGKHDFVYANPYHILREWPRQGYIPLVRDRDPLRGVLVVRKDSALQTPRDLDGKVLAIPSPNALGASLLIRADLEQIYKVKMQPLVVKTHNSVYLHVANGLAPAGGGVEKTLSEQDPAVRDTLRVLYTTREIPSHPVAAHPRVPLAVRNKIQQAFIDLAATSSGHSLLQDVPMSEVVRTSLKDYQPMMQWGLESFWVN